MEVLCARIQTITTVSVLPVPQQIQHRHHHLQAPLRAAVVPTMALLVAPVAMDGVTKTLNTAQHAQDRHIWLGLTDALKSQKRQPRRKWARAVALGLTLASAASVAMAGVMQALTGVLETATENRTTPTDSVFNPSNATN